MNRGSPFPFSRRPRDSVIHPPAPAAPPQLSLNAAAMAALSSLRSNPAAYAAALHKRGGVTVVDSGLVQVRLGKGAVTLPADAAASLIVTTEG
jgi:hypothetical protein